MRSRQTMSMAGTTALQDLMTELDERRRVRVQKPSCARTKRQLDAISVVRVTEEHEQIDRGADGGRQRLGCPKRVHLCNRE